MNYEHSSVSSKWKECSSKTIDFGAEVTTKNKDRRQSMKKYRKDDDFYFYANAADDVDDELMKRCQHYVDNCKRYEWQRSLRDLNVKECFDMERTSGTFRHRSLDDFESLLNQTEGTSSSVSSIGAASNTSCTSTSTNRRSVMAKTKGMWKSEGGRAACSSVARLNYDDNDFSHTLLNTKNISKQEVKLKRSPRQKLSSDDDDRKPSPIRLSSCRNLSVPMKDLRKKLAPSSAPVGGENGSADNGYYHRCYPSKRAPTVMPRHNSFTNRNSRKRPVVVIRDSIDAYQTIIGGRSTITNCPSCNTFLQIDQSGPTKILCLSCNHMFDALDNDGAECKENHHHDDGDVIITDIEQNDDQCIATALHREEKDVKEMFGTMKLSSRSLTN